mmetsp:Transcript_30197/g.99941  ORF Transcript_30197/g.99941 Transcript_30197/m.99941 type:complete len:296 (-) Transcript_30197:2121-3008(-)
MVPPTSEGIQEAEVVAVARHVSEEAGRGDVEVNEACPAPEFQVLVHEILQQRGAPRVAPAREDVQQARLPEMILAPSRNLPEESGAAIDAALFLHLRNGVDVCEARKVCIGVQVHGVGGALQCRMIECSASLPATYGAVPQAVVIPSAGGSPETLGMHRPLQGGVRPGRGGEGRGRSELFLRHAREPHAVRGGPGQAPADFERQAFVEEHDRIVVELVEVPPQQQQRGAQIGHVIFRGVREVPNHSAFDVRKRQPCILGAACSAGEGWKALAKSVNAAPIAANEPTQAGNFLEGV